MDEKMLKVRKALKAKKPVFKRQDFNKKARINEKWRRPKGLQSKMRYGKKGKRRAVSPGFGSPRAVLGLTPEGFVPVIVANVSDLKKIEEGCIAVISSTVGQRKKAEIVKKADELGIKMLNVKDPKGYMNKIAKMLAEKKEAKHKQKTEREKKKAEKEKKAEEKEKEDLAEKLTDEEKKEQEKKEREKVLTKKES